MNEDSVVPEKGTKIERLMAMYTRLSPENRHYILGKAEGICVVQTVSAGGTPVGFAKRQEANQEALISMEKFGGNRLSGDSKPMNRER